MRGGWVRRRRSRLILGCTALALLGTSCSPGTGSRRVQPPSAPAPRVVVSLTFNDGLASQYAYARPVLDAHRMAATFYLPSGWLDAHWKCCMAWWQVDQLYREGHEIGGMGVDHADLTARASGGPAKIGPSVRARLRQQVCDDRRRLLGRGYDPWSFAYPEGRYAAAFSDGSTPEDIVQNCGYRTARAVGGLGADRPSYANLLRPVDPYALRTPDQPPRRGFELAELKKSVTDAAARGAGWLPFAFDRVCHRGAPDYTFCMASPRPLPDTTLSAFLDWLAAAGRPGGAPRGTVVKTVRAAMGAGAQPPLPARTTIVSLTFDDGSRRQYLLRSALLDRKMRATFYINSVLVDRRDGYTMSWSQIQQLGQDGNDVGGYTLNHKDLGGLSAEQARREICDDRRRLQAKGLNPVSFAYPFGVVAAWDTVRSCGYRSARTTGGVSPDGPTYSADIPPRNRFATQALAAENDGPIRLGYLQSAVRSAAAHGGGWVQIIFHQVCRASEHDFGTCMHSYRPVDVAVLEQFLDWLAVGAPPRTQVRTVREVVDGSARGDR
jgi:peptidoglycan/xylan/chitin deacetylase (PgdA/CDA1 family)